MAQNQFNTAAKTERRVSADEKGQEQDYYSEHW